MFSLVACILENNFYENNITLEFLDEIQKRKK